MGGIRHEPLLLVKSLLDALQHAVKGHRQLRKLILGVGYLQPGSQVADFNRLHRVRHAADRLQQPLADKIPQKQRQHQPQHHFHQQNLLNEPQEPGLRSNRPEKMQAIGSPVDSHRHFLIINHKIADFHHLEVGIRPQGRLLPDMLPEPGKGRRIHIAVIHHIATLIGYLQKNSRHHAESHVFRHILPDITAADNHLAAGVLCSLACWLGK